MKLDAKLMRRVAALFGVLTFIFYINPAASQELFDIERLKNITTDDPDYKFKIVACNLLGFAIAEYDSLKNEDGSKSKSSFFTNKEMKTFDKQYYNLIGSESEFRKILDDKRLKPLVRK